jgi:hypothetical protein
MSDEHLERVTSQILADIRAAFREMTEDAARLSVDLAKLVDDGYRRHIQALSEALTKLGAPPSPPDDVRRRLH